MAGGLLPSNRHQGKRDFILTQLENAFDLVFVQYVACMPSKEMGQTGLMAN